MAKRKRATLIDVALEAGVSKTTVSQILNGRPISVSEQTRRRVMAAVEKLNYTPNALIRALQRRKTQVLGVVPGGPLQVSDWHALLMLGIARHAREHGYDTLLYSSLSVAGDGTQIRKLSDGRCDGAVVVFSNQGHQLDKLAELELPCVQIGSTSPPPGIATVSFADRQAGYEATRHLLALGHKRIAHFAGPIELWDSARERLEGYRAALAEYGVPWDPALVSILPDWSGKGVGEVWRATYCGPEPPTAVVACNKATALEVRQHAQAQGRKAPDDLSLVAMDDFGSPEPVTAIQFSVDEMARLAVQVLTAIVDGDADPDASHLTVTGRLADRRSSQSREP